MKLHFYKDLFFLFLLVSLAFFAISCGTSKEKDNKKNLLEFEVCKETELPDELKLLIDEKKEKEFQLTYENSNCLYLAVGYGRQQGSEYVAAVRELYEEEDVIVADMILIGLSNRKDERIGEPDLCPYIVLRCEKTEKPVAFVN